MDRKYSNIVDFSFYNMRKSSKRDSRNDDFMPNNRDGLEFVSSHDKFDNIKNLEY